MLRPQKGGVVAGTEEEETEGGTGGGIEGGTETGRGAVRGGGHGLDRETDDSVQCNAMQCYAM